MSFRFEEAPVISRQNRRIVQLCKLADRKSREETGQFRFDGVKLMCEAIRRGVSLTGVFLRVSDADRVEERMRSLYGCGPEQLSCPVIPVEDSLFDKISLENAPEGVICTANHIDKRHKKYTINKDGLPDLPDGPVILMESVRDPVNVGAVIRSAAALGVSCLILSQDCADLYHPRTLRAAMGPLFSMPILRVDDLAGAVRILRERGRVVSAAALDDSAVRLGAADMAGKYAAAVIGNEGHGLSDAVIAACDRTVYIPMEADTESLNAGAAAALLMWEMKKR